MSEPIDINIDASCLSGSSHCMLAWYRMVVEGYREPLVPNDIIYGVAVHKFIDTMYQTDGDLKQARDAALKSFNVPKYDKPKKLYMSEPRHLIATCFDYWERYVSKDTSFDLIKLCDKPATEVTFKFLYYTDSNIRVWLCGTMDKIGKIRNGVYAIGDYKTTSLWSAPEYFTSFDLSIQLRFYVLALKWMAEHESDSILGQIGATNVGTFIDALFVKPCAVDNEYKRSQVFTYREEQLTEVKRMLDLKIHELSTQVFLINNGAMARPLKQGLLTGTCTRQYGKCSFFSVCANQDEGAAAAMLAQRFVKKPYNPLAFNTP